MKRKKGQEKQTSVLLFLLGLEIRFRIERKGQTLFGLISKHVCPMVENWGRFPSKENNEPDPTKQRVREDSACAILRIQIMLNYMRAKRQLRASHTKNFSRDRKSVV